MASLDDLILEREFRRCFPDWNESTLDEKLEAFEYFCATYWHIFHPEHGRILFKFRDSQRETARTWISERRSIALKARQVGFSTLAGAFAFWRAFGWRDRAIAMISKGEREATELLAKSRYGYRFLPDWLKLKGPYVSANQSKMTFTNESYIESLPSASDPARGKALTYVIVDEMGQLPNSEEAWASIEPTAEVGGSIIMLGTANGEGNLFHKLWMGSSGWGNGTNGFVGIFHSWRAGGRDDAWYAKKKAELPEWQLAQEYPDNPDEAFLKSGRPVFNAQKLREMPTEPPVARGYLIERENGNVEFEQDGGELRIWRWPLDAHRYSIGVDVAEGLEHGDYTSVHVLDTTTNEVVAHWHGHCDPDVLGEHILPNLGRFYNQALLVVESNNHGLTTLIMLRNARYHPIFRRRRQGNVRDQQTEALGFQTTVKTKPRIVNELNGAVRDGDIVIYDAETCAEMRTFVRDGNGKMHGSPHDDRVMSLALANHGAQFVMNTEYRVERKPPHGSLDWWYAQPIWGDEEEDGVGRPPIGSFGVRKAA